jgi:hypothetical protein
MYVDRDGTVRQAGRHRTKGSARAAGQRVVEELIALGPQRQPPPGFENRMLDRVAVRHPGRRPARRRLRRLAFAAAMPAIAAAIALAMSVS